MVTSVSKFGLAADVTQNASDISDNASDIGTLQTDVGNKADPVDVQEFSATLRPTPPERSTSPSRMVRDLGPAGVR